jgi:bacterial/archaeal transporter family-2 protein
VVIVSILCVPRIGAASLAIALVAGQLIGALLLDQFGWLGLTPRPISTTRLCGALLLIVSVWLMQRD